jgi:sugar lactone lactonase YvrE
MPAYVQQASATELVVRVPVGAETGPLRVHVAGQAAQTSAQPFRYLYSATVHTLVGPGHLLRPRGLALDQQGNLLIADNTLLWKLTPAGELSRIAGSGATGLVDGPALSAQFGRLTGVAVDAHGTVYLADWTNNCVRLLTADGQTVRTLAGSGTAGYTDGVGGRAQFSYPEGLAVNDQNEVLVADAGNACVRLVTPSGQVLTLAGLPGGSFADGVITQARFGRPVSVALDKQGRIYVSDTNSNRLRCLDRSQQQVRTVAGTGQCGDRDGPAATATLYDPAGVCVDAKGHICLIESNPNRIRLIAPDGYVQTLVGFGVGCPSQEVAGALVDGSGEQARVYHPYGVATGGPGVVFVADEYNRTVRRLDFY